jgi:hypothetical protein
VQHAQQQRNQRRHRPQQPSLPPGEPIRCRIIHAAV